MDPLVLQEEEERKYHFHPFGFQFTRAREWDGALSDTYWLWPWIKPYRLKLVLTFVLFLVATLIAVAIPRVVAKIVDDVLVAKTTSFEVWGLILAGLMVTKIVADLTYKWVVTKVGQKITTQLRNDVFYQLGAYPLSFFDKNPSGRLISRCVNDISNLAAFFTSNFFTVLSDVALIIGCVIVMASLSLKAAGVVLVTLVPMTIFMLNVSQAQMRWGRALRNVLSRLSSHAADTMNNLGVLHSQPFAGKWSRRHERLQDIFAALTMRNILTWGSFSSAHVLVMGITYSLVISLGVYQLRQGEITIGEFIAACTYVGLIFGPFFEISEKLNTLVTALGSVKRLRTLLPEQLTRPRREISVVTPMPQGPIRFEGITFAYRPDRVLFADFHLEIPEGEVTALVGRTGSGKTTLAHLMLGLYPLSAGVITWGGEDLHQMTPERRARWIGHISQDLFLFTDTLRENLRLWREDVSDQAIQERLERVGLWEKVKALPLGLDMIVKAETLPFSQGEKQLMLLCRALLQDPRLLIFDEATASLDQLSEEDWLMQVGQLFQGRTTLIIAHRLESLKLATHIVVLEDGKIKKTIRKAAGTPVNEDELH